MFIILRSVSSLKICALCGSVSVLWVVLLFTFYLGYEIDVTFTALLMGSSIIGFMFLLEHRLEKKYQLFKLPYFLTLVSVAYFVLTKSIIINVIVIISLVWLIMFVIYMSERIEKIKLIGKKIVDCCKNW